MRKWFLVDSKLFVLVGGGGGGEEGNRNLLQVVETYCKEGCMSKRIFDWKETCRYYSGFHDKTTIIYYIENRLDVSKNIGKIPVYP